MSSDLPLQGPSSDRVVSVITLDMISCLRKKYYIGADVITAVAAATDSARSPPPGYITVYETNLNAGFRFPPAPEAVSILRGYSMCLAQASHRTTMIIMGLVAFFRAKNVTLTLEIFTRICKLSNYASNRVACKGRALDLHTSPAIKGWSSRYFFVRNDWSIPSKWLPIAEHLTPLHLQEEDIVGALGLKDVETLQVELKHMNRLVAEEYLFKTGISFHPGRSDARMLKKSNRVVGKVLPPAKVSPNRMDEGEGSSFRRKRPIQDEDDIVVPGEYANHESAAFKTAVAGLTSVIGTLTKWNKEYVHHKYSYGEHKRRINAKCKESTELGNRLSECRLEMSTMATSLSLQKQENDKLRQDLVEALSDAKVSAQRFSVLEAELLRLQTQELERAISLDESAIVDAFKNSITFQGIINDKVEEARAHLLEVEVKEVERQSLEEGLYRGIMKGMRLVHRQTGANIEGLSPSQVSDDPMPQDVEDDAESFINID